jgi:hypothetical protein
VLNILLLLVAAVVVGFKQAAAVLADLEPAQD